MKDEKKFSIIEPTYKLKSVDGRRYQCFHVDAPVSGALLICCADFNTTFQIQAGVQDILLPEARAPRELACVFNSETTALIQNPVRRLNVHIIQSSHHDYGYTDLSSAVLEQHAHMLEQALRFADSTADYPEDAKFRINIEQFWSLEEFLKTASSIKREHMLALLRSGDFEVNALYGNMITEVCGHEAMLAVLEPAFEFAGKYDVEVKSAEHNDIPGFSWGLARALCDAGVEFLGVGFPQYHCWGGTELPAYWNEEELLGHPAPGGFWWEAPDGKRLLLWSDHGYGYTSNGALPNIEGDIDSLMEQGYPYAAIRYPVSGASMDNSPYIPGFCAAVKKWNEQWDSPHLIISTNRRFYRSILPELGNIPVHRGDVPGQDYPMGTLSLAHTTALNTRNHNTITSAEALEAMMLGLSGVKPRGDLLHKARTAILAYDEHCFGFHFPCGPAAAAAKAEQELHAYRAAAWIHASAQKSMAELADMLPKQENRHTLVVFNTAQSPMTALVSAQLREFDNAGQYLRMTDGGFLKPAQVAGRWHVSPQDGYLSGAFMLTDENGNGIPYQIDEIETVHDAELYASQRLGLGCGTKRYGFFEIPEGLKKTLRFVAEDVPSCGWKSYYLVPCGKPCEPASQDTGDSISNDYYTIRFAGERISIMENETGRELVMQDTYVFGEMIVRDRDGIVKPPPRWRLVKRTVGTVCSSLVFESGTLGHPYVTMVLSLTQGIRQLSADFSISKDATPLLTTGIAFPFAAKRAHFTYDGTLGALSPAENNLSGSYCDALAAHGWLRQSDTDGHTVVCSPLDGCMFSFSEFRNVYVSTAHRGVSIPDRMSHSAPGAEDFSTGGFFALVDCNNFGTNFSVSNSAQWVMRYRFTTLPGEPDDACCDGFARTAQQVLQCIFKHPDRGGALSLTSLYWLSGDEVSVIYLRACGDGYHLALWNRRHGDTQCTLHWRVGTIVQAYRTNAVHGRSGRLGCADHRVSFLFRGDEIIYCELEVSA